MILASSKILRESSLASTEAGGPRKRRKLDRSLLRQSAEAWDKFQNDIDEFDIQHAQGQGKIAFDFVEGPLVKALRSGDWCVCLYRPFTKLVPDLSLGYFSTKSTWHVQKRLNASPGFLVAQRHPFL
jgi:hypothetical protein